jgi:hypothetical protein
VQIVYEQQSGDALVIWTVWSATPKFRVWNGVTLGPEIIVPIFTDNVYFLRAASDPTSDTIVLGGVDKFYDFTVGIWDGTAWTDSREVWTDNASNTVQGIDFAWEASGEDALVVWASWSGNVRYLAWKKGTALADSTIEQGPKVQGTSWLIRLHPISQSEKIVLLVENTSNDLRYSLWDGDRLKGDPAILLESDITVQNQVAFDLTEANVPRSGGTGSGIGINQPPTVDAGLDETIYLPINQVDLDGTVTDDGLPNPPATVDTTWIKVSGIGTVTFDDPSLVDTVARFSDAGEYVLKLTADDSELSAFDEVTIIVDAGCTEQLLYVVKDSTILTSQEAERRKLMVNWGWTVTLIDDDDTQANFDAAAATNDVAYISQEAVATTLGSKLNDTPIGVVNENKDMLDDFGFATGLSMGGGVLTLNVDPDHYITSVFETNPVAPYVANEWYQIVNEPVAEGVDPVGTWVESPWTGKPALMAMSQGALLIGGGTAAGRRVQIPWGSGQGATPVDINSLSDDGRGLIKRSIEWGGGCDGGGSLLFVVPDASNLGSLDSARKALIESWGFAVEPFTAAEPLGAYDLIASKIDVVYVSSTVHYSDVVSKLKLQPVGVVNEVSALTAYLGFTSGSSGSSGTQTVIVDNAHEITSPFSTGDLTITSSVQSLHRFVNTIGPGFQTLSTTTWSGDPMLMTLDEGDELLWGGKAPARRVMLPWGGSTFDINALNNNGQTIMKRAIEWAARIYDPPTPDPMTWASPPTADGPHSIRMTATTASDPSGVEYYFECTAGGGTDSGWQDSSTYADTGLSPETHYTYRVKARDKSASQNETGWSSEAFATTPSTDIYVFDITMGFGTAPGNKYFGRATVWIKSASGENISGAVVSGDWSGSVSGTSMGTTGSDGKVMLESPAKKNGGTFTFTVTAVSKIGYTYNPSLNVETSDTIEAP